LGLGPTTLKGLERCEMSQGSGFDLRMIAFDIALYPVFVSTPRFNSRLVLMLTNMLLARSRRKLGSEFIRFPLLRTLIGASTCDSLDLNSDT
jgi:hypothetical protein